MVGIDHAIGSGEAAVAHDVDGERCCELSAIELAQALPQCLLMAPRAAARGPRPSVGYERRASATSTARTRLNEKVAAYLAAGAVEVWLVAEDGDIEMFAASGPIEASSLGIALALPH
jgi:hypothetical protein